MNYPNKVNRYHILITIRFSPQFWKQEGGKIMCRPSHILLMDQNLKNCGSNCFQINEEYLLNLKKKRNRMIVTVKRQKKDN